VVCLLPEHHDDEERDAEDVVNAALEARQMLTNTEKAKKKLRRYAGSHEHAIKLKAEIMVDHFHERPRAARRRLPRPADRAAAIGDSPV